MRDPFHLYHRVGIEQAFDLEQGHSRVVTAKVRAMDFAQRFQLRAISVAVGDVDVELDDVLQPSPGGLDHGLEVFDDLLVLGDEVAGRYDAALGVARVLPGQHQQTPTFDDDAMTEAARPDELRRIDNFPFAHLPVNSGFCLFLLASNQRRWSSPISKSAWACASASIAEARSILHSLLIIVLVIDSAKAGPRFKRSAHSRAAFINSSCGTTLFTRP